MSRAKDGFFMEIFVCKLGSKRRHALCATHHLSTTSLKYFYDTCAFPLHSYGCEYVQQQAVYPDGMNIPTRSAP